MRLIDGMTQRGMKLFVARTLTQRCRIEREVRETDYLGSPTFRREIVADDVPCRVISTGTQNRSAVEVVADQETMPETYRIIVGHTVALDVDQTITCDGREYRVVRAVDGWTDEVFRGYMVVLRRGGDGEA